MERRGKLSARTLRETPQETVERIRKAMTCTHYHNGGDCDGQPPGTECDPEGCTLWELRRDSLPRRKNHSKPDLSHP